MAMSLTLPLPRRRLARRLFIERPEQRAKRQYTRADLGARGVGSTVTDRGLNAGSRRCMEPGARRTPKHAVGLDDGDAKIFRHALVGDKRTCRSVQALINGAQLLFTASAQVAGDAPDCPLEARTRRVPPLVTARRPAKMEQHDRARDAVAGLLLNGEIVVHRQRAAVGPVPEGQDDAEHPAWLP